MMSAKELSKKQSQFFKKYKKDLTELIEDVIRTWSEDFSDTVEVGLGEDYDETALFELCESLRKKGYKYCLIEKIEVEWSEPDKNGEKFSSTITKYFLRISIRNPLK